MSCISCYRTFNFSIAIFNSTSCTFNPNICRFSTPLNPNEKCSPWSILVAALQRLILFLYYGLTFGTGVLHLIQINHQPDATVFQFIILTFVYTSTCFGRFPTHHQELNDCSGSLWFYLRIVVVAVLCSWSGRPDHEHSTAATTIRK